jgi:hypothetical protein
MQEKHNRIDITAYSICRSFSEDIDRVLIPRWSLNEVEEYINKYSSNLNINYQDENGQTALMHVFIHNMLISSNYKYNLNLLQKERSRNQEYISSSQINIDKLKDFDDNLNKHSINLLSVLIKNNIDLNVVDKKGDTALMHALRFKEYRIAKILINVGADLNIQNLLKESAFTINEDPIIDSLMKNRKSENISESYNKFENPVLIPKNEDQKSINDSFIRIQNELRFIQDEMHKSLSLTGFAPTINEFANTVSLVGSLSNLEHQDQFDLCAKQNRRLAALIVGKKPRPMLTAFDNEVKTIDQPGTIPANQHYDAKRDDSHKTPTKLSNK